MEDGLTEAKIEDLDAAGDSFSERERMAVEYAEMLAIDHHNMDDAFFDRLKAVFSEQEILELGIMADQYIGFGRLLAALDLTPKYCGVEGESDLPI